MKYSSCDYRTFSALLLAFAILPVTISFSQTPNVPYVSPTAAASGMTSGLENGATRGTIGMMQVRASAQEAERAAAAAAMARSAETAIEEQGLKSALSRARETRRQKMEAAERLKWQRATAFNAYNKVSVGEMQTWKDSAGNVKVGRGIPSDFALAVREEEARAAAAAPKKRGGPLQMGKKLTDRAMKAVGGDDAMKESGLSGPKPLPAAPPPSSQGRSLTVNQPKIRGPKLKIPKFSMFGKKRNQEGPPPETPQFANASSGPPAPAQAPTASASASPSPSPKPSPSGSQAAARSTSTASTTAASIPARSAAALLKETPNAPKPGSPASADLPPKMKKSGGFFSRNNSSPKPTSSPRRFSFGKKKSQPTAGPSIDSGLFPAGAMPSAPRVSQASGGYTAVKPAPLTASAPAPSAPSSVTLPGASPREAEKKKFALPKPKIPTPKNVAKAATGSVSPTSTVNKNGNTYYIVEATSQFMKYGASRSETSISAVQPGMVVMMTKPGEDWATVRLTNGSSGVIQTKNLRAASSGEVPANFAPETANYANTVQKQINGN